MTVVNPKSISGINSITTGSGSDDILTIHTNNGTERLRVDSTGTTKIVTGIVTTLTATTGIVTTLTTNTLTANSTTKVGSGVTLSPDGDVFATGITTVGTGLSMGDNVRANFGDGGDLQIYHSGSVDMIEGQSLYLIQESQNIILRNLAGDEAYAKFFGNGAVELYHNGTKQCETSANGLAFPSGKGIDFSATGQASGNTSELFDDYEEGTWTPNIRNDGATATWTTQQGRYVKIGEQVTVWFNADGGSTPRSGGGSGALIMTGLPFSQVMFGNPILGIIGANDNASSGLYSTAGLILNAFGQGGTQVRFGVGGQSANFGINYVAGCFTYTA